MVPREHSWTTPANFDHLHMPHNVHCITVKGLNPGVISKVGFHFTARHCNSHVSILYGDCLLMSRTKTNRRTDREQYTRSNAVTARLLTLVKPAET